MTVHVEIIGLDRLQAAFKKFPEKVNHYIGEAALQASSEVIRTKGLKSYPPGWAGNAPPTPYYIRGRGTQTSSGHNTESSERYGSQWYVQGVPYGVKIGNEASYAPYLAGSQQVRWASSVGWRKLLDVAMEKRSRIATIFSSAIGRLLKDIGLT